eukprot:1412135-Amphidinium_carterae.1
MRSNRLEKLVLARVQFDKTSQYALGSTGESRHEVTEVQLIATHSMKGSDAIFMSNGAKAAGLWETQAHQQANE